jgi:hypothetical protein
MVKNFDTAARRGESAVANPVDITFQIDGEDLVASPPTTGQLALFLSTTSGGGMAAVRSMFDFLEAILDDDGFATVQEKLNDGVDLALITEIISYLIGEWSDRPTVPASASTASPRSTGRKSTARQRPKG